MPYYTVNSAGVHTQSWNSELFGHRKGAFTGAVSDRIGKVVQANRGSLFLDEIGDMPTEIQAGILRVLQIGEVTLLGSSQVQHVDVRFIAATNKDIEHMAASGTFRADLLDRLRAGGTLYLVPLRERKEDIPELAKCFMEKAVKMHPGTKKRDIMPEGMEKLLAHDWPGNIRELESCITSAVLNNRDVPHLVPVHIELQKQSAPGEYEPEVKTPLAQPSPPTKGTRDVDELITIIEQVDLAGLDARALSGRLPKLQQACAHLVARLLREGLIATSRPTPDNPDGELYLQPAMKLLLGNSKISTSAAASAIKRIIKASPKLASEIAHDPVLSEAHETAERLRPSQGKAPKSAA